MITTTTTKQTVNNYDNKDIKGDKDNEDVVNEHDHCLQEMNDRRRGSWE